MFEFSLTLGPLRIAWRLASPEHSEGSSDYADLTSDYELAADDYEEPA